MYCMRPCLHLARSIHHSGEHPRTSKLATTGQTSEDRHLGIDARDVSYRSFRLAARRPCRRPVPSRILRRNTAAADAGERGPAVRDGRPSTASCSPAIRDGSASRTRATATRTGRRRCRFFHCSFFLLLFFCFFARISVFFYGRTARLGLTLTAKIYRDPADP